MWISRVVDVQNNDTVAALRRFAGKMLAEGIADRLFAPVELLQDGLPVARAQSLGDREGAQRINPLVPLMTENAALALRQALGAEPGLTFAALLRPCEVRAVIELAKRGQIDLGRVVLIGVDCLGTYDEDFYHEVSAGHPEDPLWLMHESLRFAERGQIAPYRYRAACQLCDRPSADYLAADILVGLIGLDARQKLLVIASERDDARFRLAALTDRLATERETVEREVAVWRLSEQRQEAADRKLESLGLRDASLGAILGYLSQCNLCGECLQACPMCSEELSAALGQGQTSFIAALIQHSQRLMSCSACGMCQATCPQNIPLCAINRALTRPMQERLHYVPGRDRNEPLPWRPL